MNSIDTQTDRLTKGVAVVNLVKILKIYRRNSSLKAFTPATEALFHEHILPNRWYPHDSFLELLEFVYRHLLGSDEQNAVQMGINGGLEVLQGVHGAFVQKHDPVGSILAMRHIWPTYYNFGALDGKAAGAHSVRFIVTDYPDISIAHAMMIIGWGIAAAQLGGASDARYEVLKRPWKGDSLLSYRIDTE
ncbi:MAG: hypothetical protein JXA30_06280 [Deltaproteobacteria bacterium]|nr:hypothetical protein [Deltaproteobacteria bacterium]